MDNNEMEKRKGEIKFTFFLYKMLDNYFVFGIIYM